MRVSLGMATTFRLGVIPDRSSAYTILRSLIAREAISRSDRLYASSSAMAARRATPSCCGTCARYRAPNSLLRSFFSFTYNCFKYAERIAPVSARFSGSSANSHISKS
eukprot:7391520-Prymnesium_polylepis.1